MNRIFSALKPAGTLPRRGCASQLQAGAERLMEPAPQTGMILPQTPSGSSLTLVITVQLQFSRRAMHQFASSSLTSQAASGKSRRISGIVRQAVLSALRYRGDPRKPKLGDGRD